MCSTAHFSAIFRLILMMVLSLGCANGLYSQGSVVPDAGPLVPTMKTLQQVEPRTPVSSLAGSSTFQHTISSGGSYYLTENLEVSSADGILISAPNVVLDLNGFRIHRSAGTQGNGGRAILINHTADGCVIKDGTIEGFNFGISSSFGSDGQENRYPRSGLISHLTVRDCTNRGISVGDSFVVSHCAVARCAWNLFGGESVSFEHCTASHNVGNGGGGFFAESGSSFLNCTARQNEGDGFKGGDGNAFTNCTAIANGVEGFDVSNSASFTNCTAEANGSDGFLAVNGASFSGCTATENSGNGFQAQSAAAYTACAAHLNGINGFLLDIGSNITGCAANGNGIAGIFVARDSNTVRGNTCSRHNKANAEDADRAGIRVIWNDNVIDGNACSLNDIGIDVTLGFNLIVRNTCNFNPDPSGGGNYEIVGNNMYGPIIDLTGSGQAPVSGSSAVSTLTAAADHPWANFAY